MASSTLNECKRGIVLASRNGVVAELRKGPQLETVLPVHFHEEIQVILSERRLISYQMQGRTILSPLSSVFLIEYEVAHSAAVRPTQPTWGDLRTFLVPRVALVQYLHLSPSKTSIKFSDPVNTSLLLLGQFRRAHDVMHEHRDALQCETVLTIALRSLIQHGAKASNTLKLPPDCERRLCRARDYLASDLDRDLTLCEVAANVNLSPFHFLRSFRKRFGMTPHAFRTQLKLNKAKRLLAAGLRITQVACETGFADHAHLTRTFRRYVGVPPSRWRHSNFVQDSSPDFP